MTDHRADQTMSMRAKGRRGVRLFALICALIVTAAGLAVAPGAPASAATTYTEQQGHHGANTFANYHNASGMGTRIDAMSFVEVSCKVYDPFIQSANPDGYWYRIASSPWNDQYYAVANTFFNGDPINGPYSHNTDFNVPDCDAIPAEQAPPPPVGTVSMSRGDARGSAYRYAISVSDWPANSAVSVTCYDSVSPEGFFTFDLGTDGSGNGSTGSQCFSADTGEHWVVANGVESNHVSWSGAPTGNGSNPGTGSGTSPDADPQVDPGTDAPVPVEDLPSADRVCQDTYGAITPETHGIFGGDETNYNRTSSMHLVCTGFGYDDPTFPTLSPQMACAIIAAGATYAGPAIEYQVEGSCDILSVAGAMDDGNWAGAIGGKTCGYLSKIFATGVGILAAGATAETGPGAVAVGVGTYKALSAFLKVACGGIFDGGAHDLGVYLETKHEANVAHDITLNGKCLRYRKVFGYVSWSAADC